MNYFDFFLARLSFDFGIFLGLIFVLAFIFTSYCIHAYTIEENKTLSDLGFCLVLLAGNIVFGAITLAYWNAVILV